MIVIVVKLIIVNIITSHTENITHANQDKGLFYFHTTDYKNVLL